MIWPGQTQRSATVKVAAPGDQTKQAAANHVGLIALFLALVNSVGPAVALDVDTETERTANVLRIADIDREAVPLVRQLQQTQQLIDEHNRLLPDRRDRAAVAAYNSRSDELNTEKSNLISRLNRLRSEQDRLNARNAEIDRTIGITVAREQDAFDRMNTKWLRAQESLIRESVNSDRAWRQAVLESLRRIEVPSQAHRPRRLDALLPGDVLLFEPEQGWNRVIPPSDYLYRVASDLASGAIHAATARKPAPVSHALIFVKQVNGVMLFLDHTHEGSRILDRRELARKYKDRGTYVARPDTVLSGRLLWSAAREAALRNRPHFGVLPGQLVCSEQVCAAIARSSRADLSNHRLGPIDITPGDFFDAEATGKYFIVSPLERDRSP